MTKKEYPLPEETSQSVNEPQAAYGFNTEIQRPPCQYTLEELNKRLDQAEEEARQGLGLTTEELRKNIIDGIYRKMDAHCTTRPGGYLPILSIQKRASGQ